MNKSTNKFHWQHLIWAIFFIAAVYAFIEVSRIESITCLVEGKSQADICQQLDSIKNKSLFFFNFDQADFRKKILKNEKGQSFAVLNVEKKLPNKLIIHFDQQDPSYRLLIGNDVYLVNQSNYVSQNDEYFKDLVLVELVENSVNKVTSPKIDSNFNQLMIKLIVELQKLEIEPQLIKINGPESIVKLNNNFIFLFDCNEYEPLILAQKIKLIFANLDISQFEQIESIDLRFNLPVVNAGGTETQIKEIKNIELSEEATPSAIQDGDE
ncbi:MAG: hypothetical protein U9O78_00895 [Patescibacteria group bacterium]|nr:hypothetical protein [Patescibacteria group bacterium]